MEESTLSSQAMNEETSKEEEKEEEDTNSDGGFVKVEREGIDTKDDDEKTELENSRKMIKEKESVYALLKDQEENIRTANEKLTKVLKENEVLEAEITSNDAKMKEICNELEEKLKCSDENFFKTDALLSQALFNNSELEQKLKSLEEIFNEFGSAVAENATQKSLSLEDVFRSSLQEAEEAKSQLKELKTQFIATEKNNVELVQKLYLLQLKNSDAEGELKQLSVEISELKSALVVAEEEEKQSFNQKEEYEEKVTKLESSLNKLEEDLRIALQKGAEHEDRGNMSNWRNLELKGKLKDMEILVQTEKYRIQELEEQFSSQIEADSKMYLDQVADLKSTLEEFQAKNSSLEAALNVAGLRESEVMKKLKSAEEKLEQKAIEIDEAKTRNKELENQIEEYKRKVQETVEVSDTRKAELDDILLKVKNLVATVEELRSKCNVLEKESEALTEVNLKLNQELANHNTKDMQKKLQDYQTFIVKNAAALSDKVAELTSKLQEHEHKASERDLLNEKVLQLQKKLQESQTLIVKQTKTLTQKQSELEATLKKSQEVELRFKELEEKVKLADAKSKETEVEEVKSGDIGLYNSAPTQTIETKHQMTVKIVLGLGVALVAIILGIIIVRKKF